MNEEEEKVQKALGTVARYSVHVTVPVIGCRTYVIVVDAENENIAYKKGLEIFMGGEQDVLGNSPTLIDDESEDFCDNLTDDNVTVYEYGEGESDDQK